MRKWLGVIILSLILLGCSKQIEMQVFENERYGFRISYPSHWSINEGPMIPPPPRGTFFQNNGQVLNVV